MNALLKQPSSRHLFVLMVGIMMVFVTIYMLSQAHAQTDNQIVFASDRDGNLEIYAMDAEGNQLQRLTFDNSQDIDPAWSPDKQQIVFASNRSGNFGIYVMNADGSNQHCITPNDNNYYSAPSWSPDGRQIALVSDRTSNLEIYAIDLSDNNLRLLTNHLANDDEPNWGPDGRITFSSNRDGYFQIYVMNANDNNLRRLTTDTGVDHVSPAWSPDGQFIAFVAVGNGYSEVYVMNADGSNQHVLLSVDEAFLGSPTWSIDGQFIAYELAKPDENTTIQIVDVNDQSVRQLTALDSEGKWPSWSSPSNPDSTVSIPRTNGLYVGGTAQVHVTDEGLKLRAGPGIDYQIIENLPRGTRVTIIGESQRRQGYVWWKIRSTSGHEGWVVEAADGLTTLVPMAALQVGTQAQVYVEDEGLKLRSGPGTDYPIIENLPRETIVTIIGDSKIRQGYTWWQIRSPSGNSGWAVETANGIVTLIPLSN